MNKGVCRDCRFQSYDQSSLCHHPTVKNITLEIGDEGRIRAEFKKRLDLQFQPFSWAVRWCKGYEAYKHEERKEETG